MSFKREGPDRIILTLTQAQFSAILFALGIATGRSEEELLRHEWLRVADAINVGNPDWNPYFPPGKPSDLSNN
jgi:hypothetical protein